MHDSLELPEPPETHVGETVQARLVEFVVTTRLTEPVKPFIGVIVIVELPETPTGLEMIFGFVVRKSGGALGFTMKPPGAAIWG
jgi:hypothetical protein